MKEILFVDDEVNVLQGLQRMLYPMRREWKLSFASSGVKALDIMAKKHVDIIVSDMRMPGMDGAALLAEVKRRFPDTLRFVLTGQSESEAIYRTVGDAHQFLSKPCKPALLKECIDRAIGLKDLLANDAIRSLVTQIGTLPPVPAVYEHLCEELKRDRSSVVDIGKIIEGDPAMAAKILKLVNCAGLGVGQQVSSVRQAVTLLGLDTIKALVLVAGLLSYAGTLSTRCFSIESLRQHSLEVANFARLICHREAMPKDVQDEAYTAGVLHDAGMLVMAMALRGDYDRAHDYAVENGVTLAEAEMELYGCTHAGVGAYLIGIWGLPTPIVEAVAYHHHPSTCAGMAFTPLTAVHVADVTTALSHGEHFTYRPPRLDADYLRKLGIDDQFEAWKEVCLEAARNTEDGE
jgi:HD-like signal output (HDOD) protein